MKKVDNMQEGIGLNQYITEIGPTRQVASSDTKYSSDFNHLKLSYKHDESVLDKRNEHEIQVLREKAGWFGRCLGHDDHSSKNITLVIIVLLVFMIGSLTFYFFDKDKTSPFVEMIWNQFFPILTLALGYIFGKK